MLRCTNRGWQQQSACVARLRGGRRCLASSDIVPQVGCPCDQVAGLDPASNLNLIPCREEELAAREQELRLLTASLARRTGSGSGGRLDGRETDAAARQRPSPIEFPLRLTPAMQLQPQHGLQANRLPSSSGVAAAKPSGGGGGRRSSFGATPDFGSSASAATPGFGSGHGGYGAGERYLPTSRGSDGAAPAATMPRSAPRSDQPAGAAGGGRQPSGSPDGAAGSGVTAAAGQPQQCQEDGQPAGHRGGRDARPAEQSAWQAAAAAAHERRASTGSGASMVVAGGAPDSRQHSTARPAWQSEPQHASADVALHHLQAAHAAPPRRQSTGSVGAEARGGGGGGGASAGGRVVGPDDTISLQEAISIGEVRCGSRTHGIAWTA